MRVAVDHDGVFVVFPGPAWIGSGDKRVVHCVARLDLDIRSGELPAAGAGVACAWWTAVFSKAAAGAPGAA
jgi:hypothetical protein